MAACWCWICSIVSFFLRLPEPAVCARCRTQFDCHIFLSLLLLPSRPRWFVSWPAEVFRFIPSQHSLKSSSRGSDSTVLPLLCPLICVRSCCVYLSIYLSVCLPVSMSVCLSGLLSGLLSVCVYVCVYVWMSAFVCLSPLCSLGFCGTPRDECSFPTRFQMWCSARMTAASQPTSPCSSPAATGWLPCSAAPSWRVTSRR